MIPPEKKNMQKIEIRKLIRALHIAYDDSTNKYKDDLQEVQRMCSHELSRYEYRLDTYGEIATNEEGTCYMYAECRNCGHIARKLRDEFYDSEIPF